jgi:membrane fusion protein (multidrug efflux system)
MIRLRWQKPLASAGARALASPRLAVTGLAVLLASTVASATACGKAEPSASREMPPPEVGVVTVEPRTAPLTRELVGRLSAYRSADVRARVAGVLLKRTYEEGTDVKKGDRLFQIDAAPLKATLDAALATLAQAEAKAKNEELSEARAEQLASKGAISQAELEAAQAAARGSAAAVQQARASVQSARINLGYATVTAPIDGRAGQQQVTEGALVGDGQPTLLTTVEQLDPLYVNFTMSVAEMEQMRRAETQGNLTLAEHDEARIRITLPDGTPYPEEGVLGFSDVSVNPATGAVDLRAQIPNPKRTLLPGMYVNLTAKLGEQHDVFLVPQAAVQRDSEGAYVMTVGHDGVVARENVTTADLRGGDWIVTRGLESGDEVVVSGVQKVKAGAPAKAVPWQRPAPGASSGAPSGAPGAPSGAPGAPSGTRAQ